MMKTYRQVLLHKNHIPPRKSLTLLVRNGTDSRAISYSSSWSSLSFWNNSPFSSWRTDVKQETLGQWNIALSGATFSTDTKSSSSSSTSTSSSSLDWRFCKDNRPTLEYAKAMPRNYSAMNHEQILQLCAEGKYEARREALIRNIMAIDEVEYDVACAKVLEIAEENRKMMHWEYSPYHMGIFAAMLSGGLSFPLIFDKQTVLWFNRHFVTAEVPDAADLETIWEVGSWSWGWMEPVIGQASFVLLVLQFARSQAMKLGMKPYGDAMLSWRSQRLVDKYPQYDSMFVEWFAESEAIYGNYRGKE